MHGRQIDDMSSNHIREQNNTLWNFDVELHDVTSFATDFDLEPLSVISTAHAWMTRAERLLLYTLTFTLRPRIYLEIGILNGGSALIVCTAMDTLNLSGKIIGIDPESQIDVKTLHKLEHRTIIFKAHSPDILPKARDVAGQPFDLVLIDGDHSFEGVLRDGQGVLPHCRSGAFILFHDCFFTDVKKGIDDFVLSNPRRLIDLGPLTREKTVQETPEGQINWGGLRAVQVR